MASGGDENGGHLETKAHTRMIGVAGELSATIKREKKGKERVSKGRLEQRRRWEKILSVLASAG